MKMKSFALVAVMSLLSAPLAYVAPVLAGGDDAGMVQSNDNTTKDDNATDNNSNDASSDQATPDTATGDDDY